MKGLTNLLRKVPNETYLVRREFAQFVGISLATVYRWENNPEIEISHEKVEKALEFFNQYFSCDKNALYEIPAKKFMKRLVH